MNNKREQPTKRLREATRLEAFSDGVFAIAITLLVLELISILHPQNGEGLLKSYLHHWQPFVAFLIGFITILVCWINHHHALDYIDKIDSKFMWVNGFLLLLVTITPFPTAILAEFLESEGKIALSIFGLNYFMIAIAAYCICAYAYNQFLISPDSRDFYYYVKQTYAWSILYTLISFFACFFSIPLAIVLYVILFLVFAFPKEFATRLMIFRQKRKTDK